MRSEFQNVFKDAYDHWIDDACSQRYHASKSLALQVWQHQQSKVDELQRRNQMLNDNIKEQGQKLVYQNEVIETQAEKLLGLRDEKAELQKRVDKALQLLAENSIDFYEAFESGKNSRIVDADELEQALKG